MKRPAAPRRLSNAPDFLGIKETAQILRVIRTTVRRALDDGRIKFIQWGKRVYIPRAELERVAREAH